MANLSALSGTPADPYAATANALVIAEGDDAARDTLEALARAGIRTRARIGFAQAATGLADHAALDLIVIEAEAAPDALFDTVLARADTVARERPLCLVATVAPEQIDAAVIHLLGPRTQLLCNPSAAERAAALAVARVQAEALAQGSRVTSPMHDASREAEAARLQRLNEEVARIADTLARLARNEDGELREGVRAPDAGYRGEPPDISAQEIRTVIRSRRLRGQYFASELFADPAWDMLLDLFAAELERRRVSVSSLCIAAAVPPTTALRWIGTLHDAGLFERHADPSDRRRAYIALSEKGLSGMRGYIAAAKRQGLGLV